MNGPKSTIERAFEIAREGKALRLEEIARQLQREGYADVHGHLDGAKIRAQLMSLVQAARAKPVVSD
ncbi:hypothetical protein ACT009_14195 [Sphingomonas sp. Tas61C01]|uniref:hypothetical protein n=1 Tax=Sphingomonas sp. Tas61C01 TaxID=3458297 RepID=UPI00403E3CFF